MWADAKQFCADRGEYLMTFATAESSRWFREKATELGAEEGEQIISYALTMCYVAADE